MSSFWRPLVLAAVTVLVLPVAVNVQSGDGPRPPAGKEWPAVGGDSGNSRHSTLNQITTQNVTKLGGAWTPQKLDSNPATRSMPVVRDGLMFLTAGPNVYALDARTGARVWRFQGGQQAGMGAPDREGVAIGDGLVFVGLSDARVIALREKTGELVWNKYVGDKARDKGQVISGAPVYAGGIVSVGLSADNGWRGQVVALNGKSGDEAWRFFAVPAPGEPGSESWPKGSPIWQRGGGAVWLVGASDPDLGLVYYVTGNGVPQLAGEGRPGANLYLCSVVAIDMKTGKLRWHYQTIRHDIWEADIAISPVLYDAQIEGRSRKAIAAMRADGYLFMLDRETGKPLSRIEDRPVPQDARRTTAATQPFPAGADSALPDCAHWKQQPLPQGFDLGCDFYTPASVDKPNLLTPTFGMRVAPMAYSPDTGYFYAAGNASLGWLRRDENPWFFSNGFNQRVPGLNRLSHGLLAAIDSRTNKVVWKKEFRPGRPTGAMTTAGGLMFQSAPDGNLQAYDARTGNLLWQFQLGAAGGPPLTYEIGGEQYVAAVSSAGVWVLKLGGTVPQAAAPARPPQPELFGGQITDTTQIETASLVRDTGFTGFHYMTDEYAFSPYRARVKRGAQVTWRNNGLMVHTIVAQDGSWTTGPLNPADVGGVTFDKPGSHAYMCKEHPWAVGQIVVTE
ncbi:MAG TPA: PQQ-binding-like beta-propeller repeat protein [Vicinamibacterales bacterium]|nr:PQQ-binding-like beta-propeller repeat protein [Vicinamibacterales bacterium]